MRLKYFMRGMGLGIVLTALILSLTNTKEKLTDQEIMKRASELGMVTEEQNSKALEQVLAGLSPTQAATDADVTPTVAPTDEALPTEGAEITDTPKLTATPKPTVPSVTPEPTGAAETTTPKPTQPATSDSADATTITKIGITITKGMPSDEVAGILEKAGLVDDAKKFNNFIINAGKASVILPGKYTFSPGLSYQEIVDAIVAK